MTTDRHGHMEGRSQVVLGVTIAMIVAASAFVFFRLISRGAIVKKISVDDWFMVLAWVISFGLSFSICFGTAYGLGRHEVDVPLDWQAALKKSEYAFSVLYNPALMAAKTSILVFYLTLSKMNRIFRWATIATLVVVNIGGLALTLLNVFQCQPVGAFFERPLPASARCTDIVAIYLSSAPLNIITDMAILFIPMPVLTGMRLPRKQKAILVITFGFGVFVAAVDVVRITYLQSASMTRLSEIQNETNSSGVSDESDLSWYASLSFMWSAVEVNVGIMCACVPALKPLVSRFMPRLLRDASDAAEESMSLPDHAMDMAAEHHTPSLPETACNGKALTVSPSGGEEGPMGMMDFLTTPEMKELPSDSCKRTQTTIANTSRLTPLDAPHFFDFVDMEGKKSMVHMTSRESYFPIAMVTVLFFIWGFEYGLLDVLNQQFQRVAHMSSGQSMGIHSAYFAGYLVGPLCFGRLVLKHWGFKACYTVGLSIYACGTLIFWPAAVLTSFPAFLITNFIVGMGLSILEVAANPFIALCGPAEYAEIRLNFSQGVQAIGSIVAPLIANKAFFRKSLDAPSLIDTQWAYLGISLFTILLAVAYYYVPLPEASDTELEDACERLDGANKAKIGKAQIICIILGLGVFSQFCYVGAQEVNATTFDNFLAATNPTYIQSNYMAIAHTAFAVSRFLSAGLGFFIKPRIQLLAFYIGAIVFSVLSMQSTFNGTTSAAMLIMVFFMEGPLFSLIFAQTLRGMGRHTKIASVLITSATSGGAVFAPIANSLAQSSRGVQYSLCVAVAAFAGGTVYAIGLNGNPLARRVVDPVQAAAFPGRSRPSSTNSRASTALGMFGAGKKGIKAPDGPTSEWREGGNEGS